MKNTLLIIRHPVGSARRGEQSQPTYELCSRSWTATVTSDHRVSHLGAHDHHQTTGLDDGAHPFPRQAPLARPASIPAESAEQRQNYNDCSKSVIHNMLLPTSASETCGRNYPCVYAVPMVIPPLLRQTFGVTTSLNSACSTQNFAMAIQRFDLVAVVIERCFESSPKTTRSSGV